MSQLWVGIVPEKGGRILTSRPPATLIRLGSLSHCLGAVATEVAAAVETHHLNRVVHAANPNVAHIRVLECRTLTHLTASSIERAERRPVDAKNNPVRPSVDASLVGPGWDPVHRHAANQDSPASCGNVLSDIVVAELQ